MRWLLRLVVPVGWHAEKHLSASYQEAVGLVYLTLHPQLMTMAEALVHEFQHNKVNAAFALDPLLVNAFSPLYPSPVRPDPRPLHGVLLAVHAFQPVARLYQAMIETGHDLSRNPAWLQRYVTILRMNRAGAATVLDNGQPTALGRGLLDEMRRLDTEFVHSERQRLAEAEAGAQSGRFFDAALAEH
jgi:HEXXH motif-containing protein